MIPTTEDHDEHRCKKVEHIEDGYYLHTADYDGPYDIDGVTYCGRCHWEYVKPRFGADQLPLEPEESQPECPECLSQLRERYETALRLLLEVMGEAVPVSKGWWDQLDALLEADAKASHKE